MAEATLRQMQYFLAVLDHGSVTAAAKESHVSQSALSMAIAQLESIFGAQLFVRNKAQKVVPTPAALRLEPHARNALESVDLAHHAIRDERHRVGGLVRIGCLTTLSPSIMPALIKVFSDKYPAISVRILEGSAVELQEKLRGGQLDVVFLYHRLFEQDLTCQDLQKAKMHAMLPAGHPRATDDSVFVRDIQDLPLILLDIPPTADSILGILTGLGVEKAPRLRSSNVETIREYIGLGLGFCLTNTVPVNRMSFGGHQVAYVPLADNIPANAITAVTLPGHPTSRRVRIAINVVAENLQSRGM